jgi:diguanylate cyclase (GGDEF)-like protein/PAS domain S-box-containing protein
MKGGRLSRALRLLSGGAGWGVPRWIGAEVAPGRFFEGSDVSWRFVPFVLAGVVPFLLLPAAGISLTDTRVLVGAALVTVIVAAALRLPWERLPAWAQAVPPLAYFVVFALLRDADGAPSAFDPLVALPSAWFALYGTPRQLIVASFAAGLALAAPVWLVGAPEYDSNQYVLATVMVLVSLTVGGAVQLVVTALRRLTYESGAVIATAQEAFLSTEEDGTITEWNPEAERLFGWSREEALGREVTEMIVPERNRARYWENMRRFLDREDGPILDRRMEIPVMRRDGTEVPVELSISPARIEGAWIFNAFMHDISERLATEAALRDAEERFRRAFDDSQVGMTLVSPGGHYVRVNAAFSELTGRPIDELTGMHYAEITHPEDLQADLTAAREMVKGERYGYRAEKRYIHAKGHPVWISLNVSPIRDADGELLYMIGQIEDISERKDEQARLTRQALQDSLTGLPNRALFADRVRMAAARRGGNLAVVYLDLDDFKHVNDSLGHAAGDKVLIEVGHRLKRLLRAGDTLARLGGDEFAILCEGVGAEEMRRIGDRVVAALAPPIDVAGRPVHQAASIGVAIHPRDGTPVDADSIIGDADLAMYRAKAAGRSHYAVFESWMRTGHSDRTALESELREALGRNELRVHYQPEVDLSTGLITGAEALVRWQHPERGLLEPGQFLFLAESSDLISEIDDFVLRDACGHAADWRELNGDDEPLNVSVNVSDRRLSDPNLSAKVAQAISDSGIPASMLCLEIAERSLIDRRASAPNAMPGLEELGIRLLVDDFGVAISSFGSLQRLPRLNAIKIDASFVAGLGRSQEDSAGVAAMVGLAHGLKLTATAEGVENANQMRGLRELNCDRGQGYYFARPQPPAAMGDLLQSARLGELIA